MNGHAPIVRDTREVYDMRKLRDEDRIQLNLLGPHEGPPSVLQRYETALRSIIKLSTRGGTQFDKKPVTYRDPDNPVYTFEILAEYKGLDVTTKFVVYREDIYFCAVSLDHGQTWRNCKGSRVRLIGCKIENLNVSYMTDSKNVRNEFEQLDGKVGFDVVLTALFAIHHGNQDEQTWGLHRIANHFAEPVRDAQVARLVARSLTIQKIENQRLVTLGGLSTVFNMWHTVSSSVRQEILTEKAVAEGVAVKLGDYQEIAKDWPNIKRNVTVLLKEREDRRMDRRQKTRAKNRAAKYGRFQFARLRRKRSDWTAEMRRTELKALRDQEMESLIARGGYADIWRCLNRALRETDDSISKFIIQHTDVNVTAEISDLSVCYDDNGFPYELPREILCDPSRITED